MQLYELIYIIKNEYSDEQIPDIAKKINELATKTANGAVIKSQNLLGRKRLAYPIKHALNGYYVLAEFEAEPSQITELNRVLELNEDILRHMITKKEEVSAAQMEKVQALKARIHDAQTRKQEEEKTERVPIPTKKHLVQKPEDFARVKKDAKDAKEELEELDEKLDEILKRDIV